MESHGEEIDGSGKEMDGREETVKEEEEIK